MPLDAIIKGLVSRMLPQPVPDNTGMVTPSRFGRYNEQFVVPLMRTQHGLADEGTYFTASAHSAPASSTDDVAITGQTTTAYDGTKPSFLIQNIDSPSNMGAKRIYLDWLSLLNGATA